MGSANSAAKAKNAEFEVKYTLGRGSHSDVVAVQKKTTKEMFAVKRIQIGLRTTMEQAKFEAKTLCSMNHPGVLRAFDWWVVYANDAAATADDASALHIQLELAKQDLLSYVRHESTQQVSRALMPSVARQLLSALVYLHGKDIVHRDIKLENVLVTSITPLVVKLGDLSLANTTDECELWPSAGTICTKAPESMHQHPFPIDGKSDIYSLGVTLFAAATGLFPFCAHSVSANDKHVCDGCEDLIDPTNEDEHSSLEGSHYTAHICVSGKMCEAIAQLEPEQRMPSGMEALLLAMCAYDPADRPAASECLRFEALQFRLRAPALSRTTKKTITTGTTSTTATAQKRTIAESSVAFASTTAVAEAKHQPKKTKKGDGGEANKENKPENKGI